MHLTLIFNRNTIKPSKMALDRSFTNGRFPTKEPKKPTTATAKPITSITLASTVWSSIIARLIYPIRPLTSCVTSCSGKPGGSPASDAIAGPLKSITKRGKRMGWISIKYGTSRRYPGISHLSPLLIAYCVPPNTMRPCFTNCNDMSRRRWMVRQEVGVATPRHKRCGPWQRSSPRGFPMVRRFKMSWNPSLPCLPLEDQPICFARSWMSLAWGRPSQGTGDVWPLPDRNRLILRYCSECTGLPPDDVCRKVQGRTFAPGGQHDVRSRGVSTRPKRWDHRTRRPAPARDRPLQSQRPPATVSALWAPGLSRQAVPADIARLGESRPVVSAGSRTYSQHYCTKCRKYFHADLSDLAPPGAQYTHRVIELAVRLVVEDGLPYRPASWHLWRDHRVFVPFATIQNWVEAGGKKGTGAYGHRLPGLGLD